MENKKRVLVGCIYRPPHSCRDYNLALNNSIGKANQYYDMGKFPTMLVGGDFNYSDISWSNEGGICEKGGRNSSIEFLDHVNANLLTQHVAPTFVNKTLDLILTNDPQRIYSITHGPPLGSSKKNKLHLTLTWKFLYDK